MPSEPGSLGTLKVLIAQLTALLIVATPGLSHEWLLTPLSLQLGIHLHDPEKRLG